MQNYWLTENELDRPIYRVLSADRLLETIRTGGLTMVHPTKWEDPFENLLDSTLIGNRYPIMGSGPEADAKMMAFRDKAAALRLPPFGQCWTWNVETDAMWRIYSPDKLGAKIKTTPRLLIDALKESDGSSGGQHCFIGSVRYKSESAIRVDFKRMLNRLDPGDPHRAVIAESLMLKRTAFKHEKEVRLLYTGSSSHRDTYFFPLDHNATIQEIVFDPRMSDDLYRAFVLALRDMGYKLTIRKSKLYQLPRIFSVDIV